MADLNGLNEAWDKLVDISRDQVRQAERQTALLEQVIEFNQKSEARTETAVKDVVEQVTRHIDDVAAAQKSAATAFLRDFRFWLAFVGLVVSNFAGPITNQISHLISQ